MNHKKEPALQILGERRSQADGRANAKNPGFLLIRSWATQNHFDVSDYFPVDDFNMLLYSLCIVEPLIQ